MSKSAKQYIVLFFLPILMLAGCSNSGGKALRPSSPADDAQPIRSINDTLRQETQIRVSTASPTAVHFDSLGLVNVARLDSSIAVSLLYATPNNFVGEILYDDLTEAYLHPEAAEALLKAQRLLKDKYPDYSLIVYDATRPMSAQRKMWNLVKGTSKNIYVSNPARGGGLHNYGLAVDISILDADSNPLPMGTEVDHLGPEAHTTNEAQLVKNGIITQQEKENRELLRQIMRHAGFRALHSEWWHFNLRSREVAKKNYQLIE